MIRISPLEDKAVLLVGLDPKSWDAWRDLKWASDNNAEMWTLNNFYKAEWLLPYFFDMAFQIHENDLGTDWIQNYAISGSQPVVCNTSLQIEDIRKILPGAIEFDIYEAERQMGTLMCSSSWCFMFKMARDMLFAKVRLAGIDLRIGSGYEYQIPGVLAWIDFLRNCGVSVEAPLEDVWRVTDKVVNCARSGQSNLMLLNEARPIDTLYGSLKWSKVREDLGFKVRTKI